MVLYTSKEVAVLIMIPSMIALHEEKQSWMSVEMRHTCQKELEIKGMWWVNKITGKKIRCERGRSDCHVRYTTEATELCWPRWIFLKMSGKIIFRLEGQAAELWRGRIFILPTNGPAGNLEAKPIKRPQEYSRFEDKWADSRFKVCEHLIWQGIKSRNFEVRWFERPAELHQIPH